ncbi:hypothetical protein N7541_000696 [Penicillium brevicompactum]|uniref:Azaphilone pigments biosynthesis cluster protein L N-terminal domain-containing protein n=1 Tax=Penicillium brevicompactum TaxID=5074 RepID=A0A9W9RUS7_PENBR|nr:hypothetical protein N7541_000696 [Penicillium brevicompactum]
MADPLSVAGSAIGVLAYGMAVTNHLIDYFSAFKQQDTDVAKITQNSENVLSTLLALQTAIQHHQSQADAGELPQRLKKATQKCFEIFERIPIQDTADNNTTDTTDITNTTANTYMKGVAPRIRYELRRGVIQKIAEDIGEIHDILSLELNNLQLKSHTRIADASSSACDRQSEISVAPSIFSLPSKQSTSLTTNSHLNAVQMDSAIDELVGIFLEDEELKTLYREVILEKLIAQSRFIRNFRRLLKRFAVGLKEEAGEAIDVDLANLISINAGLVAYKVASKIEQQYSQLDTMSTRERIEWETQDDSSADEDENGQERALDERFPALVSHGRSFIKGSIAFQKLQEELKIFIMPSRLNKMSNEGPNNELSVEVEPWLVRFIRLVSFRARALGLEYKAPKWTERVQYLQERLTKIGMAEKAIPKNHQRFRWKNVGIILCYDFNIY